MGAGKQLNIDLTVNANTKQAEKNIQELSDSLKKLADIQPLEGMSLNKDMQSAVTSARELQHHLSGAMNSKTGNLDLSKLSKSLKSANTDIATLSSGLLRAGRDGEQAFMNVQRALSTASVQINKANGLLGEFWVTLKNTARWQISSTALHAFVGSLQTAYGYAKNLDESLNNIRIVTGHNIEYMDKFAEKANKAAKALSSTTLDYTNASLIYYQQGLSDEEVSKRTEVTLKMANAAGESAEKISDQLTSVWNNFAKGSDNLEHYADAMVRLGADTASSTDEIADGVQKFASVASTIGLSFDNAAAALATITATTRESADVVGTALKTLFARIQGLNLGETLDDGTTVNKYSAALEKVGVNIKDANGNLKDMDTLLDEIGNRWQTLERDQKTALAQTVAGVRQYTQFMNLMENFDFYQENVARANNADGSLQEQADIYAESWEAARDRMRAAMEGIYDELLPTQTIIKITDGVTDVIGGIETLIKGLGGLKGILLIISSIALKQLGPELGASLQNGIDKVGDLHTKIKDMQNIGLKDGISKYFITLEQNTKNVSKSLEEINDQSMNNIAAQSKYFKENLEGGAAQATRLTQTLINSEGSVENLTSSFNQYLIDLAKANNIQGLIDANAKHLTAEQREQLSNLQQQALAASEKQLKEEQILEDLKAQNQLLTSQQDPHLFDRTDDIIYNENNNGLTYNSHRHVSETTQSELGHLKNLLLEQEKIVSSEAKSVKYIREKNGLLKLSVGSEETMRRLNVASSKTYSDIVSINTRIKSILDNQNTTVEEKKRAITEILEKETKNNSVLTNLTSKYQAQVEALDNSEKSATNLSNTLRNSEQLARNFAASMGSGEEHLNRVAESSTKVAFAQQRAGAAAGITRQAFEAVAKCLQTSLEATQNLGNSIVQLGQHAQSIAMAYTSIKNIIETLNDSSADFSQKFTAIAFGIGSISAAIPSITAFIGWLMKGVTVGLQASKAVGGLTGAVSGLTAGLGALLTPMTIVLAVAGALYVIYQKYQKVMNEGNQAFEEASTAASNLAQNYNDCKTEFDEMVEAFSQYTEISKGLDTLIVGTDEYKEKLKEANQQASELINKYHLLATDYTNNDGRLIISEEAMSRIQREKEAEVNQLNAANNLAQANKTKNSKTTDFDSEIVQKVLKARGLDKQSLFWGDVTSSIGSGVGTALGIAALLGTPLTMGTSGIVAGGMFAGAAGLAAKNQSRHDQADLYSYKVSQALEKAQQDSTLFSSKENMTQQLSLDDSELIDALWDLRSEVTELANEMSSANDLQATYIKQNAHDIVTNDETSQNSSANSVIEAVATRVYDEAYDKAFQQYENYGIDEIKKFAELKGLDSEKAISGINAGKGSFKYWDNEQEKYVDYKINGDELAILLAENEARQKLIDSTKELDNNFSGLNTESKKTLTELANTYDAATNSLNFAEFVSSGQFSDINNQTSGTDLASKFGMSEDQLLAFVQQYGYKTIEAFRNALVKGIQEAESTLTITDKTINRNVNTENASISQQKAYSEAVQKLGNMRGLGNDASKENRDNIEGLTEFFKVLGVEDVNTDENIAKLKELKAEYDLQGPAIDNLIQQVEEMPRIYNTSGDAIIAENTQLQKSIKSLKTGDTIDANVYDQLKNAGVNVDKYFTEMNDGTYKLVGTADDLREAVNAISTSSLLDTVKNYQKAINNAANENNVTAKDMELVSGDKNTEELTRARLQAMQNTNFTGYSTEGAQDYLNTDLSNFKIEAADMEAIQQMYQEFIQSSIELQGQTLKTASSLDELQSIARAMDTTSLNTYGEALVSLANNYDNCATEIEDYQQSLLSNNGEQVKAAIEALEASVRIGEAAEKYGINADAAKVQAKQLASNYKLEAKAAADLAIRNARMNKGVTSLVNNWKDWRKTLTTGKKTSLDYAKAVSEVTDTIQDLVGATTDLELPTDFFDNADNLKLLDKAMAGDAKSIELLGTKTAEATVESLKFNDALSSLQLDDGQKITLTSDEFDSEKEKVLAGITELQTAIQNGTIGVGDSIDSMDSDWVESLNKMALATNMSVDEMNSLLNQMGVQAKVDVKYVEQDTEVPTYTEVKEPVKDYVEEVDIGDGSGRTRPRSVGSAWRTYVVPGKPQKVKGYVPVAQISTEDNPKTPEINEGKLPTTYTGHGSVSPSSTKKSGSGSKSKPSKQTTKKSDVVDRYKEITDSLDNIKRAQDKVKNGLDQLYGKSRLDAMDEYQAELQKEIDLLDTKAKKAKEYADEDWKSLQKLIHSSDAKYKFNFVRNKDGNITNYTSEMEKAYNLLHTYEEKANKMTSKDAQDAYREKWVTPLSDYLKEVNDTIDQYDESVSTMKETLEEKLARIYEQYQNMFDKLSHKLEVKITVDDNELKKLNYYFDSVSDNVFKASEAFGYLYSQMKPTSAQLENVGDFAKELNELFYNGKIGEEQYAEGLQQAYDDTLNYLQSLRDLDNQMIHYYEETLQKATEKLTTYTDQMDHLTSVMDHYRSILTLMGRDTDYDKVLEILEGTAQTRKNNFEVSQSWYEQMKKAKEDAAAMLAEARTDAEKEMAQISYDAAVEQFNQAEETMLANAESYGEALKEILTTKMQQAADAMNKALTDGMGWDVLNDSMSRTSAYQDEYLTKTNQIYEMNKLLNQVNSAIDKTDNQGAKNRYAQFAKEIEQLREKNQLSQLELDIAQAKYKVLEAQIALEEAQNAKSTVRLQRDSEGNFGYVYTADQDKVNDAEQALADAENDLYNIRLNATNKYGQQKLQYEQELAEKLAELDEKANDDALYREGNYQEDRERLIEEYQKLIEASNDLYNLAQEEDARVVQDAWVNGYKAIIDKGNEWKTAVGDYTDAINNAIGEWEDASSALNIELENTTRSVEEITTESDAMYNQLKNDLIPTLGKQLDLVEQITLAYQHQRDDILKNIKVGEIQLKQLQRLIELQASYTNANNGEEYASGGDYSLMMGKVAYGSDEYWSYYTNRQGKLNKNPDSDAVSNEDVDRFYFLGYKLGQGMWSAYSKFQQIPADKWEKIREDAKNAGWVKHFDTGGYTGKWGTEGRLAFLHQKELVLNADDTSNFLKAIKIVREIAQTIDLRSGSMFRGVGPYLPPVVGSETQGMVDQQVSIQASFPNVVSHNEIEEAFNNLINTSVQYANRKIK